jgi:gamma-glutamylcyclotransferase (GGCT)/AIG2-like uncharacterized protein YtfP
MYHKVFVYGSLMQTKTQQEVFGQKIPAFSKALLKDWEKFQLGDYPAIRPAVGKSVTGKIIQLNTEQLAQADQWEECPGVYHRERVTVKAEDGSFFNVWAYSKRD